VGAERARERRSLALLIREAFVASNAVLTPDAVDARGEARRNVAAQRLAPPGLQFPANRRRLLAREIMRGQISPVRISAQYAS
jgi:hypothetical protein